MLSKRKLFSVIFILTLCEYPFTGLTQLTSGEYPHDDPEEIERQIDALEKSLQREMDRFNEAVLQLAQDSNRNQKPFDLEAYQAEVDFMWGVIALISSQISDVTQGDLGHEVPLQELRDKFQQTVAQTIARAQERQLFTGEWIGKSQKAPQRGLEQLYKDVDANLIVECVVDNKLKRLRIKRGGGWKNRVQSRASIADPLVEKRVGNYRVTFNPKTLQLSSHSIEFLELARDLLPPDIISLIGAYFSQLEQEIDSKLAKRGSIETEGRYFNINTFQAQMQRVNQLVQNYASADQPEVRESLRQKIGEMTEAVSTWMVMYDYVITREAYIHYLQHFLDQAASVSFTTAHIQILTWIQWALIKLRVAHSIRISGMAHWLIRRVHHRAAYWTKFERDRATFSIPIEEKIKAALPLGRNNRCTP